MIPTERIDSVPHEIVFFLLTSVVLIRTQYSHENDISDISSNSHHDDCPCKQSYIYVWCRGPVFHGSWVWCDCSPRVPDNCFRSTHDGRSMRTRVKTHPQGVQPEHVAHLIGDDTCTRKNGLGDMHVLPDELVLSILGRLEPVLLGRLATVSKALYCFANHDELWKSFVLEFEDDREWLYEKTWKWTYVKAMYPEYDLSVVGGNIRVDHMYSDLLYQPWLCATLDIDESWTAVDTIDRRCNMSLEEFRREYEEPNKPVIITDIVQTWKAHTRWSRQELRNAFADAPVIVGDAPMRFDSYLKYCEEQEDEIPLYMFDKHFCEKAPKLEQEYSVPVYFQEDLFAVLGESERPDYRWLIYGPYKSGSTFHKDPNATSAWNAVIFGSKKWIMYPPHVVPPGVRQSEDGADVASPVSLMEWMLSFYDLRDCEGVAPVEFVQHAGEILFVPRGWWHMAINLEETCAITQNYVSRANVSHVLQFLKSPHARVLISGVETEEEKMTLHDRFVAALESEYPSLMKSLSMGLTKKRARSKEQVGIRPGENRILFCS